MFRLQRQRRGQRGREPLTNLRIQLSDIRRAGTHDVIKLLRPAVVRVPPNCLHPRPEGGGAFTVERLPRHHAGTPHLCIGGELLGEPGLAAARFTAEEEQSPAPSHGRFQSLAQLRHLLDPSHKHAAGEPVQ